MGENPLMLRISRVAALFLTLAFLWPAPALSEPLDMALLVVVPEAVALDDPEVERWMNLLKAERERQRISSDELPMLRLSAGRAQHKTILQKLGLLPVERVRTFTCRRDHEGWPSQIVREHEAGSTADIVVGTVVQDRDAPVAAQGGGAVGLLLVSGADSSRLSEPFLQELGRYWLQRYGRVRPSPYPLASYDVSRPETEAALRLTFPKLMEGKLPLVALCVFDDGQPVEILQIFRGLDTPASLVREISAARGQAVTSAVAATAPSTSGPLATELGLSSEIERVLMVSRLNETAQQLWNASKEDKSQRNQGPKRILLRVIEESRRFVGGEAAAYGLLLESLRDYQVEPLKLDHGSKTTEQSARFLDLGKALLNQG